MELPAAELKDKSGRCSNRRRRRLMAANNPGMVMKNILWRRNWMKKKEADAEVFFDIADVERADHDRRVKFLDSLEPLFASSEKKEQLDYVTITLDKAAKSKSSRKKAQKQRRCYWFWRNWSL